MILNKLNKFLQSKKGNALVLTMAAAITSAMGGFFFVALSNVGDAQKQKITHLHNAYKMAEGARTLSQVQH